MTYQKLFEVSTREAVAGNRRIAQVVPVPTGRLDKVSLYLERKLDPSLTGEETAVIVSVYAVDGNFVPTGMPLATASKTLSEITTPSYYSFVLRADVPSTIAIVASIQGDLRSEAYWSYVTVSASEASEPMAIDEDGTGQWEQDYGRKMTYAAYSLVPSAVRLDDDREWIDPGFDDTDVRPDTNVDVVQSAYIQPGKEDTVLGASRADFGNFDLDRAIIIGDTIAIEFGNYVISLVVDQSGSMTWNDREGTRFSFLESFIDDISSSLEDIPQRCYLGAGMRSDSRTWSSVGQDDGFIALTPGVEYDIQMEVDGQDVTVKAFQSSSLAGCFEATLPDPLGDLGNLTEFLLGRSTKSSADGSFVSTTISEVRADAQEPDEIIFQDSFASDLGWNFTSPGDAQFTGGNLVLTTNVGYNQVGARSLSRTAGSKFVVSAKLRIDAASGAYDQLVGLSSGTAAGYDSRPAGIWMQVGFEKAITADIKFSLLKFKGRKVSRLRLLLDQGAEGSLLKNIILTRNGVAVYEGIDEQFVDTDLVEGVSYLYGIYAVDSAGNKSEITSTYARPVRNPAFPASLAGFSAEEEVVKDGDVDVGKRIIKVSWVHPALGGLNQDYDSLTIVRHTDRFPVSELDGDVVLHATKGTPQFDGPYYDFDTPGFNKANYPAAGLTYYYTAFTDKTDGPRVRLANARRAKILVSNSDKLWEDGFIPMPSTYDPTPPPAPTGLTAIPGNRQVKLTWVGSSSAKRYEVYTGNFEYPVSGLDPDTGDVIFTTPVIANGAPSEISPVYNGSSPEFIHDELENYEPYYYVLVAYDSVGNVSSEARVLGRPDPSAKDLIEPSAPTQLSAEPFNESTVVVSWELPLPVRSSIDAYFGDTVIAVALASFEDEVAGHTTSFLEAQEASRTTTGYDVNELPPDSVSDITGAEAYARYVTNRTTAETSPESPVAIPEGDATALLDAQARSGETGTEIEGQEVAQVRAGPVILSPEDGSIIVDPTVAIDVSTGETTGSTTTVSAAMTDDLGILNLLESAEVRIESGLFVRDTAGNTITSVVGPQGTIRFKNPFEIAVRDDPPVRMSRRTSWNQDCCCRLGEPCGTSNSPCNDGDVSIGWKCEEIVGTFALIGDPISLEIEAKWKGSPIANPPRLEMTLLDAGTELPSDIARLDGADERGALVLTPDLQEKDILDRSGQPSGTTEVKSIARVTIPPQDVAGDYLLEVISTYRGYSRRQLFPVTFEHPLNVDVIPRPFVPNGIHVAEQMARVYLGDPTWEDRRKIPVSDGTVVRWSITPGDDFARTRPFFSRSELSGTGIKSETNNGIAREIFFGPGTDIEPFTCEAGDALPCFGYEWYVISATVNVLGVEKTGFGVILENPFLAPGEEGLNRIFMRPSGGFSRDTAPSDGETVSTWEVLGVAREDGTTSDQESGAFFHQQVTSLGGLVPDLPDGTVVTLYANPYFGDDNLGLQLTEDQREAIRDVGSIEIKTDLTGDFIQSNYARATIKNGKAQFDIRLNALAIGASLGKPLESEVENVIYGDPPLWPETPLIYYLTCTASLPVRGKRLTFWGGGNNLSADTPPCWLGFNEPLGVSGGVTSVDEEDTGSQGP